MRHLLCAVLLAASAARAQDIDIKGLKLGMSQAEVAAVMPDPIHFTIGGVRPRYEPSTRYIDGKLAGLQFDFYSRNFELVRDAFREKYPALACRQSVVHNNAGADFMQETCRVAGVSIERFNTDVETGTLFWTSPEADAKDAAWRAKAKHDL